MMRYSFAPVDAMRGDTEISVLADKIGVSHGAVQRWRERGMEEHNADAVATALGLHPWQLWPEMLAVATAPVMRECATCGEFFVLDRSKRKRYCDRKCLLAHPDNQAKRRAYQNQWKRERRASDPEYAEKVRAENRAYKAEAARALAVAAKAKRERDPERARELWRADYWRNAEKRRAAQRERDRAKAAAKRAEREVAA